MAKVSIFLSRIADSLPIDGSIDGSIFVESEDLEVKGNVEVNRTLVSEYGKMKFVDGEKFNRVGPKLDVLSGAEEMTFSGNDKLTNEVSKG